MGPHGLGCGEGREEESIGAVETGPARRSGRGRLGEVETKQAPSARLLQARPARRCAGVCRVSRDEKKRLDGVVDAERC
jgi:hypothetical protein